MLKLCTIVNHHKLTNVVLIISLVLSRLFLRKRPEIAIILLLTKRKLLLLQYITHVCLWHVPTVIHIHKGYLKRERPIHFHFQPSDHSQLEHQEKQKARQMALKNWNQMCTWNQFQHQGYDLHLSLSKHHHEALTQSVPTHL